MGSARPSGVPGPGQQGPRQLCHSVPPGPDRHPGRSAPKPALPHHTAVLPHRQTAGSSTLSPSDKLLVLYLSLSPHWTGNCMRKQWRHPGMDHCISLAFHTAHRYSTKVPADQMNRIIVGQTPPGCTLSLCLLFALPPSRQGSWAQGHCLTHH